MSEEEKYPPEVQAEIDRLTGELISLIQEHEERSMEEQMAILKNCLSNQLKHFGVPFEDLTCIPSDNGEVQIQVCVPQEWAWIFDECEEENEEDIEWGAD